MLIVYLSLSYKREFPKDPGGRADPGQSGMIDERSVRNILRHLIGETRGGFRRAEIIRELQTRPSNTNQLAKRLGVDYKTIQRHLRILEENQLTAPSGKKDYGTKYRLTTKMEEALPILDEIWNRISLNKAREGARLGIAGNCKVEDKATSMRVMTSGEFPSPDRVGLQFSKKPVNNAEKKRAF